MKRSWIVILINIIAMYSTIIENAYCQTNDFTLPVNEKILSWTCTAKGICLAIAVKKSNTTSVLFRSVDNGKNWHELSPQIESKRIMGSHFSKIVCTDTTKNAFCLATLYDYEMQEDILFQSNNNGECWKIVNNIEHDPGKNFYSKLYCAQEEGVDAFCLVGGRSQKTGYPALFQTRDSGKTWQYVNYDYKMVYYPQGTDYSFNDINCKGSKENLLCVAWSFWYLNSWGGDLKAETQNRGISWNISDDII